MNKNLELYLSAKEAYYAGEPIMTDEEFDALEASLGTKVVGAPERGEKVKLPQLMGSLNQVYNDAELLRWMNSFKDSDIVAMEKLDGNSLLLQYKNGNLVASYSRGDGVMGMNNLRHVQHLDVPKRIDLKGDVLIRGEVIIKKDNWEECRKVASAESGRDYKNPRNFVAGFMNGSVGNPAVYKYIDFVAFDISINGVFADKKTQLGILDRLFIIPQNQFLIDIDYGGAQKMFSLFNDTTDYEIDGVVLAVTKPPIKDTVSETDLNPTFSVKIKPPSKAMASVVTKIEWNASKDGLLKPIVHFNPVTIAGASISKASGYNAKNVVDQGMGVGATVMITRQGDVIPRVDKVIVPAPVELPPDSEWNETGVELYTTTGEGIALKQLQYFFSKLEVDQMGPANVEAIFSVAKTPAAAINLPKTEFKRLIGSNGSKAFDSLHKKLNPVTPQRLFAAAGLFGRGIGERKLAALYARFPFNLNARLTVDEICSIPGFERKTADAVLEGLDVTEFFDAAGDKFTLLLKAEEKEVVQGALTGQVFCPTGVRFTPDIKAKIESQGGTISDSMSSSVTTLVAKDPDSGSSKIVAARKKGITVISLADLVASL